MTAAEGADASHMQGGSAAEHARAGANWIGRKSYSFKAPVHALSTLIDRARLTSIDLLSLDVEGFEVPVLEGIDFDRHPIRFILVETSNLAAVEEVLGLRYRLVEKLSRHDYLFEHLS
jgi:FkbM family methyltransferase